MVRLVGVLKPIHSPGAGRGKWRGSVGNPLLARRGTSEEALMEWTLPGASSAGKGGLRLKEFREWGLGRSLSNFCES
jgi:hypothetical protein